MARSLIPNKQSEYKRLAHIVSDARLAGLIDWDAIEDRTRGLQTQASWNGPAHILSGCARAYAEDLWADQSTLLEV